MSRGFLTLCVVALAASGVGSLFAQGPEDRQGSGWTGATDPQQVIDARRVLMTGIERLMRPIDAHAAGDDEDAAALREAATSLAAMLAVVPHLFPPTTDLFDPEADTPVTLALPAIWQDFSAFQRLALTSTANAGALVEASGTDSLRAASRALRASCDACHAVYLRPYVPAAVSPEDLQFDFDSLFDPD